jgi:hypothetical protein
MGATGSIALALTGCSQPTSLNAVEAEVTNRLGATQLVLGSRLGEWTNQLGNPAVIEQKDKGNTFFYWPDRGVAVFCHPLFHKQYEHKNREDWAVTAILVPLTNVVHPRIPPVERDARIAFSKLLLRQDEIVKERWDTQPKVKPHYNNGILESIEIQKPDSMWGEYD